MDIPMLYSQVYIFWRYVYIIEMLEVVFGKD